MKKSSASKKEMGIFPSILFSIIVSMISTVLVLSTILYLNFEAIAVSLITGYIKDNLSQVSYSASLMTDLARSLSSQVYYDRDIQIMRGYPIIDSLTEIPISNMRLSSFTSTSPFIESIYVYNGKDGILYTDYNGKIIENSKFNDYEIMHILKEVKHLEKLYPIPRSIISSRRQTSPEPVYTNVYSYIFYDYAVIESNLEDAVILNISEEWMKKTIETLGMDSEKNTFIIDDLGKTVISTDQYEILTDLSGEKYIQDILHSGKPSGSVEAEINHEKSIVTYVSSDVLDWKFIRITPYNSILGKINDMRRVTLAIACLLLVIGCIASYILSRRLYKPIGQMTTKLRSLEAEKRSTFSLRKQELLSSLLSGKSSPAAGPLKESFDEFRMKLDPGSPIILILFKIDRYAEFCSMYTAADRSLMKFGMSNIAEEIFSAAFPCETADMGDDHIVLICHGCRDRDGTTFHPSPEELVRAAQDAVEKHLGISFSASISTPAPDIHGIHQLYDEVLNTSLYRLIYGHRSIIPAEKIQVGNASDYVYPSQMEKSFIESLMLGKMEDTKDIYLKIIDSTLNYPYIILQSTLSHLAIAINTAVCSMGQNSGWALIYNFSSFIVEINKLETIDEINHCFFKIFDEISEKLEKRKSDKYDELAEQVIQIIENQYADLDLCISSIADMVNMSAGHLGRLFKKQTAKTIPDYITEVRIEKARDLLSTTSISVNEIIEKTGFLSSSNFYTLFKKMHGVTPNEFRRKAAK